MNLLKQAWRLYNNNDAIFVKLLVTKYRVGSPLEDLGQNKAPVDSS